MAEVNFGSDGDFSHERMLQKVNTNLANELGNLVQRTLSLIFKNCDATIPAPGPYTPEDEALLTKASKLREECSAQIATQSIQKYVEVLVTMIWDVNKYIDVMAPWALKKTDPDRMLTVLYVLMEVIRYVSILYQPIIPESSNKILDRLTVPIDERTFDHLDNDYAIKSGNTITKPEGVFPRIETPTE